VAGEIYFSVAAANRTDHLTMPLNVLLIGDRGYTSIILPHLIRSEHQVVGLVTRQEHISYKSWMVESVRKIMMKLGMYWKDEFFDQNPFAKCAYPVPVARKFNVPFFYAATIKTNKELKAFVEQRDIDIVLVAGFHRLVPNYIIQASSVKSINLHPSLLPKHRGGSPNRWIIKNRETKTGITAHVLTDKFDDGDILLQREIAVEPRDTWGDVEDKIMNQLTTVVDELFGQIESGNIQPMTQNASEASYEKPLKGDALNVDWNEPADAVLHLSYAVRPLTGAMAKYQNHKVCIWDGDVLPDHTDAKPGEIVALPDDERVNVQCGDGVLSISHFYYRGRVVPAKKVIPIYGFQIQQKFTEK
jgi:methionyl-tRNA formyltransferase